nr:MAG TPA: hypothetical protein [Caudoviricetes sp.]
MRSIEGWIEGRKEGSMADANSGRHGPVGA